MNIGIAIADITPPLGICLQGHFNRREASGIHDPLHARAFVFEHGGTRVAMVGCDLVVIPRDVTDAARVLIAQQSGIPPTHVMIWATHTHAGPVLMDGDGDERDEDYTGELVRKLADVVRQASRDCRGRSLSVAFGEAHGVGFNRRYLMRDGSIRTNPGVGNPDILRPQAPIDPQVGCLYVSEGAAVPGVFVNFACHLDVLGSGNTLISADYAYYLEETVRGGLGQDCVALFGNGASGDINHIDVHANTPQGGFERSRAMGEALGGEVLRCLKPAEPLGQATGPEAILSANSEIVPLPYRRFSEAELAGFRATLAEGDPEERSFAKLNARSSLLRHESGDDTYPAEVQVLRIGDAAVIGVPAEFFVEFGLDIKRRSPAKHTFVVELANDCIGYVPTPEAISAGAYEGNSARFSPEAGQMLADAALSLTAKEPL